MTSPAQTKSFLESTREEIGAHNAIVSHFNYVTDHGDVRIAEIDEEIKTLQAKRAQVITDQVNAPEMTIKSTGKLAELEQRETRILDGTFTQKDQINNIIETIKRMKRILPADKFQEWFRSLAD